jgi:hypothetical protein
MRSVSIHLYRHESWLGVWLEKNYHSYIFSLTFATFEIMLRYTKKESNFKIKKWSWGWDWNK